MTDDELRFLLARYHRLVFVVFVLAVIGAALTIGTLPNM